ncbi:ABC transporter ATP-binding protein [Caldichromatium japonicum]|uniref:ABC transporter ATP-binding protein n=1 Tax=Caldichromatium japonicum TaxID=2699430 RepID=UPI001FECE58C|nr:ABC transporter ATP-binding protein [Caldichromatium japonicum]
MTDLSCHFGGHPVLSGVNLELARGQVVGLLGPNGAGKTTFLRLLSGLLTPASGHIEVLGIDLNRRPLAAKRHIGYLPERTQLYPELRVDEYLTHCAHLHRIPRRAIPKAIAAAKARCGLSAHGRRLIAQLSKGYRQRLGLAQAIIHRPAILLLDEPTEGLDPFQMRALRALIRELAQESGVIFSTHLLPEAQAVCDRVLILYEGQVHLDTDLNTAPPDHVWRIRLGNPITVMELSAFAPVIGALSLGPNRFQVDLVPGATSADLARAILAAGLDLLELTPARSDLERVFFDLLGVEDRA